MFSKPRRPRSEARSFGRWRHPRQPRRWRFHLRQLRERRHADEFESRSGPKLRDQFARVFARDGARRCEHRDMPAFRERGSRLDGGTVPTIGMANAFRSARRPTVEAVLQARTMQSSLKSSISSSTTQRGRKMRTPAHFEPDQESPHRQRDGGQAASERPDG